MGFSCSFVGKLCLISLLSSTALAAPAAVPAPNAGLVDRMENLNISSDYLKVLTRRTDGSDQQHPISATFDISRWRSIAEENCYVMLCLMGGQRVFQRTLTEGEREQNYRDSGAADHPFHTDQLGIRHTRRINDDTVSAEDFPWRSIRLQPGQSRYVLPATMSQQRSQGPQINHGYANARPPVGYSQWFEINFTPALAYGRFCAALFRDPPDTSVCRGEVAETLFNTVRVRLRNFVFLLNRAQKPPYTFVNAFPPKGI